MTYEQMRKTIMSLADRYNLKRVVLFGSRADGTNTDQSDIDLIIEFLDPVSLMLISDLKCHLEEEWGLEVDIIHGPLQKDDLVEVGKEIELYAA